MVALPPAGKLVDLVTVGGQGVLETAPFEREAANDFYASNAVFASDTVASVTAVPSSQRDYKFSVRA